MDLLAANVFTLVLSVGAALAGLAYLSFRKALSRALKSMDQVFDAMPDMMLMIDRDYTILKANRKALLTLGLSRNEVIGRKCYSLLHEAGTPPADCPCAMSKTDGKAHTAKMSETVPGMTVEAACLPVFDERGGLAGYAHIARDIAGRKSLEKRLFQAGKMEALGRLAGGLAHEFNNILSIISSAFYMLRSRLDQSETAKEDGAAIQKAISAASDLTRHLLTLSQRQLMDLKLTDLNNIIKESMQIINKLLGENVKIATDLKTGLPPVMGDPAQLNKLFMSMLIHAEPAKGVKRSISVKTENLTLSDFSAHVPGDATLTRPFVRVRLTDTAYSVKKELLSRIFEPYFESRSMNLAIAYGIARQHNGWIDVMGDETGVTFEIYLPAAGGESPAEAPAAAAANPRPARPLRVLLAEDDDDLRVLTARTLRKNGHKVFEADCAEKAFEVFDSQGGEFDALISDVVMPDKSGVDLADAILKIKPDIGVILMSGYIDDKIHLDTIRKKGYKFIYKPFDVDALLAMLRF